MSEHEPERKFAVQESILEEAQRLVHGDRGEDYGHPIEDFTRTGKLWGAILNIEVSPREVALCMAALKISREVNKPKRDNRVDAAGYFETLDMVDRAETIDRRVERLYAIQKDGGVSFSSCYIATTSSEHLNLQLEGEE